MHSQQLSPMQTPRQSTPIPRRKPHSAFTLVELLVSITIIGILGSLLTAGVMTARRRMVDSAIKVELTNIELAIEAYRDKYGDYPPDFSDWNIVQRHFRTAFPKIAANEMTLLGQAMLDGSDARPNAIDRGEALVFSLGGFSSDARRPFTGAGGPFLFRTAVTDNATNRSLLSSYHYNTSRDNRLFEFDETRLSMGIATDSDGASVGYSTDEGDNDEYWAASTSDASIAPTLAITPSSERADLFPVYRRRNDFGSLPIVYFDSRTYSLGPIAGPRWVNSYQPTANAVGVAKPYKSLVVNTGSASGVADDGLFYVNRDSFQIVCAGQDEHFGGEPGNSVLAYIFPTGAGFDVTSGVASGVSGYFYTPDPTNYQHDNVTNFSSTTLESDLE